MSVFHVLLICLRRKRGRPKKGVKQQKPQVKGHYGDGARCADVQLALCQQPHFECIPRKSWDRIVKDILTKLLEERCVEAKEDDLPESPCGPEVQNLGKGACRLLHAVSEAYIANLFVKAGMLASHAKRQTVNETDLRLLQALDDVKDDDTTYVSLEPKESGQKISRKNKRDPEEFDGDSEQPEPKSSKQSAEPAA